MPPPRPPASDDALQAQCSVETLRAGTKGGQRANKVETGIRLTHEPSGLVVQSRSHRSQTRNRAAALAELRRRLEERARPVKTRRATKPTKGSKRRRVEAKKRRSEKKANRSKPRDW